MKMPILFACLVATGLVATGIAIPADAAPRPSDPAAAHRVQVHHDRWSPPQNYRPWPPTPDRPWYDRNRGNGYGPPFDHRPAPYYYAPYRPRGILPLGIVLFKLQRRDFPHIEDIRLRDNVYKVRAIDRYGRPVRLIVDPATGAILRLRYAG